jgi:hypothetical protein
VFVASIFFSFCLECSDIVLIIFARIRSWEGFSGLFINPKMERRKFLQLVGKRQKMDDFCICSTTQPAFDNTTLNLFDHWCNGLTLQDVMRLKGMKAKK